MVVLTGTDTRVRMPRLGDGEWYSYIARDVWRIDLRIRQVRERAEARVRVLEGRRAELIAEYEAGVKLDAGDKRE